MGIIEFLITAFSLSMDAFAVSVCKGLATKSLKPKHFLAVGAWFGAFQALMPIIGYYLGTMFEKYIVSFDHWIAFALLVFIGGNMIFESFSKEENSSNESFSAKTMFLMAVATSIDALAVGITLALLPGINIFSAAAIIGILTFVVSAVGLKIGNVFGVKYKSKAELVGGILLVLIGSKILFEHLGIISF